MSSCGGNCMCGANCRCGGGCKKYGDIEEKFTMTETVILELEKNSFVGFEMITGEGGQEGGCKCGSNCTCDPCRCK